MSGEKVSFTGHLSSKSVIPFAQTGMTSLRETFSQQEMSVAIKEMEKNKAAVESGVIAEYLKALEVEKLRGFINVILNGADIPKQWKESGVKLLHKGERRDDLKNYRPIAISVVYKLCMLMVREGSKRHIGGAVTAVTKCCANCVEPSRPQWGPDLPFFGQAGHADPLDGWHCFSQKRVMSKLIQV